MPSLVSKVTSVTFSFLLENHYDLRRPPVENVPSLVGLVGTKKVGFLTRPTIRCKDCVKVQWYLSQCASVMLGQPISFDLFDCTARNIVASTQRHSNTISLSTMMASSQ